MIILYIIISALLCNLILTPILNLIFKFFATSISVPFGIPIQTPFAIAAVITGYTIMALQFFIGGMLCDFLGIEMGWYFYFIMFFITIFWNISAWHKVDGTTKTTIGGILWGALICGIFNAARSFF